MTLREFKNLNSEKGFFWFESGTMQFFKSMIYDWDEQTGYFITSEKGPAGMARAYTLRKGDLQTGRVDNISEFQQFKTMAEARAYMQGVMGRGQS